MGLGCRAVGLVVVFASLARSTTAHGPFPPRLDLSDAVQVDEADAATRTHLEQVKAFVANQQWEEAVEILWKMPETNGSKMLPVSPWWYINVRDYCHLQLASLPSEALKIYRDRVDAQARRWYEEGVRKGDGDALRHVVQQFFCSSSGDDALLALGDLALEAGNAGQARGYWKKILPPQYWSRHPPPEEQANGTIVRLRYPDTDLDWAAVRARLLLAEIIEGDRHAAERDFEVFAGECPAAQGKMGGRQVNYAEFLKELLAEREHWPREFTDFQWPTLGGNFERNEVFPRPMDVGAVAWEAPLPEMTVAESNLTAGSRRVAEKRDHLLSYHPVVVDDLVLINTLDEVRAYDFATGEPKWSDNPEQPYFYKLPGERGEPYETSRNGGAAAMGVPRTTLTVHNRRVYVRLGNPVTSRSMDSPFLAKRSHVVCLDLEDEGSLIWNVSDALEEEVNDRSWAFEGSPVVDGNGVYVAMRRSGVRPQQYIASLDPENGRLKWRRLICGAETPAQGQEEITHNLLTLHAGTLYASTNLGAVAAIDARDGEIQWITRYERTRQVELSKRPKHFYRDLTPCVYYQGLIFIAPADSESVMALDAPTGLPVWQAPFANDVVHLLGVIDGKLVASGDKLWWIDAVQGKIVSPPGMRGAENFPEGGSPKGFGRGMLAGDRVYWPTWDKIYVFDPPAQRQLGPIDLPLRRAIGGNLIPAGDSLLIATHDRLMMFRGEGAAPLAKPAGR